MTEGDSMTTRDLFAAVDVLQKNNVPAVDGYYEVRRRPGKVEVVAATVFLSLVLFVVFGDVPG